MIEEGLLSIVGSGRLSIGVGDVVAVRDAGRRDCRIDKYVDAAPMLLSPSFTGAVFIAASLCPRRCPPRSVGYP